jgi:hypothetical protein
MKRRPPDRSGDEGINYIYHARLANSGRLGALSCRQNDVASGDDDLGADLGAIVEVDHVTIEQADTP